MAGIIELEEEGRDSPLFSRYRLDSGNIQEDLRVGASNTKQSNFAITIQPELENLTAIKEKVLNFDQDDIQSKKASDKTDQLSIKSRSL